MRTFAVFLLMALAIIASPTATANLAVLPARRSRFLLTNALPIYDCTKKSAAAVCIAPGSPGATCCGGQCVDTVFSASHCGGCNKVCKQDRRRTCCSGRCVDLDSDKDNCGRCGNQCNKKCSYGFCDYA